MENSFLRTNEEDDKAWKLHEKALQDGSAQEENMAYGGSGIYISCLCGKHKEGSTCEVYQRNHGTYIPPRLEWCDVCKDKFIKVDGKCIMCAIRE